MSLAATRGHESLALASNLPRRLMTVQCLETVALVRAETGAPALAARLLGVAATQRATMGTPLAPVERPEYEAAVAAARASAGSAFAGDWW